jgi:hypothetical protein
VGGVIDVDVVAAAMLDAVDRAIAPLAKRLDAMETALSTVGGRVQDVAAAAAVDHDRVVELDARDIPGIVARVIAPILERVAILDTRVGALATVPDALGATRERIAALESRPPVPGVPGANGADGAPGKDGADGLGFDALAVDDDGEGTIALRFAQGDRVKVFPVTFPIMRYRKVWTSGATYTRGSVVTWDGSMWHCDAPTTTAKPGTGAAWSLIVKRGNPGKDGATGPSGPPGRDWEQVYDARRAR